MNNQDIKEITEIEPIFQSIKLLDFIADIYRLISNLN